jgi:hypothetical protein
MYVLLHCGCARSPLLLILPLNFSSLPVWPLESVMFMIYVTHVSQNLMENILDF